MTIRTESPCVAKPGKMPAREQSHWPLSVSRRSRNIVGTRSGWLLWSMPVVSGQGWLKLNVCVDASTGEITAHVLTYGHADDLAQVPDLLRQPEGAIASLVADGAYDGEPVYQAAAARHPSQLSDVIITLRASAAPSTADPSKQSPRDRHIHLMAERGRLGWQRATGHGRHNMAETTISRYKHLLDPKLRTRNGAAPSRARSRPVSRCSTA